MSLSNGPQTNDDFITIESVNQHFASRATTGEDIEEPEDVTDEEAEFIHIPTGPAPADTIDPDLPVGREASQPPSEGYVLDLPSPPPMGTRAGIPGKAVDSDIKIVPDTNGVVGLRYTFEPLNSWIQILDLDGNGLYHMSLKHYWDILDGIDMPFDPKVVYDRLKQRYVFVTLANRKSEKSGVLIGATKSDDPTQDWACGFVSLSSLGIKGKWVDYPNVGLSGANIVITGNLVEIGGEATNEVLILVIDATSFYEPPYKPKIAATIDPSTSTLVPAVSEDINVPSVYMVGSRPNSSDGLGYLIVYEITCGPGPLELTELVMLVGQNGLTQVEISPHKKIHLRKSIWAMPASSTRFSGTDQFGARTPYSYQPEAVPLVVPSNGGRSYQEQKHR